jgi:UPF0716 protein FxsA
MVAFILLIGLPIVEVLLLIKVGSWLGFWTTAALVIGSAALGMILIRQQGLAALRAAQQERASGEIPVSAILNGIRLAFAGMLLIVPGFLTDALGLLLLIPGVSSQVITATEWSGSFRFAERRRYGRAGRGPTIDADFEVVSDRKPPATQSTSDAARPADPDQPQRRLDPPDDPEQRRNR